MKTYHVGLRQEGKTAVFEFRRCIDYLSCEILEYLGERETTKAAAKLRLKQTYLSVLAQLHHDYPNRFTRVVVD